jgi:similar to stage IV sporulation protein
VSEGGVKMKGTWLATVRGYVWVKLIGGDPEKFLNAATANKITLWNIAFSPEGRMTFGVSVPDFFRLRPLLKQNGSRTRILSRHGVPFRMARLSRRKTFAAGMMGFAAALFILSTLVWTVKVEGGSAIPEDKILYAARAEGIYHYQWSFRLPDSKTISDRLARHLPEAAWIGVEKKGTSIIITVIDSTNAEVRPLESPRDLVADNDAVVTRIIAENGRPKVERNDRVRKGDVLISGVLGDNERSKTVVSAGKVMGLVWHEYRIVSPLATKVRSFTGESQQRGYLIIGSRALQISGYRSQTYTKSQTRSTLDRVHIGKWQLPFGKMREYEMEVQEISQKLTVQQAKQAGLAQARTELLARSGRDAVIKAEKILHEQTDSGKVVLSVLFEVEQSIAIPRPIVLTPTDQGE